MPPRIPLARLDLTSRSATAAAQLMDRIRQPTALTHACNGLWTEITGKVGARWGSSVAHRHLQGWLHELVQITVGPALQEANSGRGFLGLGMAHEQISEVFCTTRQCPVLGPPPPLALRTGLPPLHPKSRLHCRQGASAAAADAAPAGGAHKPPLSSHRKASKNRDCPDVEGFLDPPALLFHSLLFPGDCSNSTLASGRPVPAPSAWVSPAQSLALQRTPPRQQGLAQTHLPQHFCPVQLPPPSPTAPRPHLCTTSVAHISLPQPQEPWSDTQTAKEPSQRSSQASSQGIQPAGPLPGAPLEEPPGPGAGAAALLSHKPGCTEVRLKANASPEPPAARQPCSQQAKHEGQTPHSHQSAVTDLRRRDADLPKIPALIHPALREASPPQATLTQVCALSQGGSVEAEPWGGRSPRLRASPCAGWGEASPGGSTADARARQPSRAVL